MKTIYRGETVREKDIIKLDKTAKNTFFLNEKSFIKFFA
jgi:hypothetical protein